MSDLDPTIPGSNWPNGFLTTQYSGLGLGLIDAMRSIGSSGKSENLVK